MEKECKNCAFLKAHTCSKPLSEDVRKNEIYGGLYKYECYLEIWIDKAKFSKMSTQHKNCKYFYPFLKARERTCEAIIREIEARKQKRLMCLTIIISTISILGTAFSIYSSYKGSKSDQDWKKMEKDLLTEQNTILKEQSILLNQISKKNED